MRKSSLDRLTKAMKKPSTVRVRYDDLEKLLALHSAVKEFRRASYSKNLPKTLVPHLTTIDAAMDAFDPSFIY